MRSSAVVYDSVPNGCQGLESAVKLHIYPPAIHCVVIHSFHRDCYKVGAIKETHYLTIEGTDEGQLSFPFQVHELQSKSTVQYRSSTAL